MPPNQRLKLSARARIFLDRALSLRECLYRIFSAVARGRRPRESDLEDLNRSLGETLSMLRVVPRGSEVPAWLLAPDGHHRELRYHRVAHSCMQPAAA